MRALGISSCLTHFHLWKLCGSKNSLCRAVKGVQCLLVRFTSEHIVTPPVLDSKVGFTDYDRERREFHVEVPEYFNFANTLDDWAEKEKVGTLLFIYSKFSLDDKYVKRIKT